MPVPKKLSIPGMSCGHCVRSVTNALAGVSGVSNVIVNLDAKKAECVVMDGVSENQLIQALREEGFEATVVDS